MNDIRFRMLNVWAFVGDTGKRKTSKEAVGMLW